MAKPNTNLPPLTEQDVQRFHSKIRKSETNACWNWTGTKDHRGYGLFKVIRKADGIRRMTKAHRVSYLLANQFDPGDLLVLHDCDNPSCVNPNHLSLGTCKKNMLDAKSRMRTLSGEKNKQAIFTESQVLKIREMYKRTMRKNKMRRRVALKFQCSEVTIQKMVYNKTWQHLL